VDHCIIFTRNQGIAITVLSKSVNVRANSVCRANNVKGTSPPSWNNKTIRKTTTHLEHHQKNYIYQSINNNNSNKNIARIEFDHSCQEVQTQFPPPGSPGESPSRTHEPPSTQNGFESKKGPQNDPWYAIWNNLLLDSCIYCDVFFHKMRTHTSIGNVL